MKLTRLAILILGLVMMLGCEYKEPIGEMWLNYKNCDEKHPSIWAPERLKSVPEYLKVMKDTSIKTSNISNTYGGFRPGDKVEVINDTLFNGEIVEIYFKNPRKKTFVSGNGYYYMWKEFLVSDKDSIAECWKNYKHPHDTY